MTMKAVGPSEQVGDVITAGPSGQDRESVEATSSWLNGVLLISEALYAVSYVKDGELGNVLLALTM